MGARMVEFGGWEMPVQYTSIIDEHKNVRKNAGLFDVSHMGQVFISGSQSLNFLQKIVCPDRIERKSGEYLKIYQNLRIKKLFIASSPWKMAGLWMI